MDEKNQEFRENLLQMRNFLKKRRKIKELASMVGVTEKTAYQTFDVKSFEELTGDKLTVFQKAIEMIEFIKSLPNKAKKVMES